MSALLKSVYAKARELNKHIVLAEGEEQRIIDAAIMIAEMKIARITLIGNKEIIEKKAGRELGGIQIIDPATSNLTKMYTDLLFELRKDKGLTYDKAEKLVLNPLYFGSLMVKNSDADGMVAGSINATSDVLRPALQIIKTKKGLKTVSSCFIMTLPEGSPYGQDGVMVYGDCGVNINPDANALADIAISCAESAVVLAGIKEPKVAMLSFSTKGSAKHEFIDKVVEATELVKKAAPDLAIDGELQADAALVASVGKLKSPNSTVAGEANVLIFPDLQSGNIAYKLTQRLAGAEAFGPICQGLAKPVNDLSRGCSADDVVGVVAMTALQAQ